MCISFEIYNNSGSMSFKKKGCERSKQPNDKLAKENLFFSRCILFFENLNEWWIDSDDVVLNYIFSGQWCLIYTYDRDDKDWILKIVIGFGTDTVAMI